VFGAGNTKQFIPVLRIQINKSKVKPGKKRRRFFYQVPGKKRWINLFYEVPGKKGGKVFCLKRQEKKMDKLIL
jgi:hypothetical protein